MNMDEKTMTVLDADGVEHLLQILFTYEHEERKKKYVFFYENDNPEEVIAMEYNDKGELMEIESDEEYEEVEEVFNAFMEDNPEEESK